MATHNWVVYALSPTLNQKVRKFDLTELNKNLTETEARQHASFFAQLQNTNKYLHVTDWCAHVEYEQHGIDTLDGYIFNDVTR